MRILQFQKNLPIRGFPELDTLRFISVSLVILHHMFLDSSPFLSWFGVHGYVGVDIFFTLSGFIITDGLNREFSKKGYIKLKSFWVRRYFRLWPAWLFTLFITTIAVFLLAKPTNNINQLLTERFWHYFLHFGNYSHAYIGKLHTLFSHYWSLAVEEHFYLIWPVIFILIKKKRFYGAIIFPILFILPYLFRVMHKTMGAENVINTFSTHTRFDALAYGCLFAFIYKKLPKINNILLDLILWITAFVLMHLGLSLKFYEGSYWISELSYTLRSLSTIIAIFLLISGYQKGFRILWKNNFIARLGQLSYGVYLVHFMTCIGTFVLIKRLNIDLDHHLIALIGLVIPYFPAYLIYIYIDKYFLKLRNKYS